MDKQRKRHLNKWLKAQAKQSKKWLMITIGLGLVSAVFLIIQAYLLASILYALVIEHVNATQLIGDFFFLAGVISARALATWLREKAGFRCGSYVRLYVRQQILDKLRELGPAHIKGKPAGTWATLLLEQVENMQDFFSRYLPQMVLATAIPLMILVVIFPANWMAGLIFLLTAPLVPLFMALVGMKAADANKKNFTSLQRLSSHFYDRLQSMTTLRLFFRAEKESDLLYEASDILRRNTMDILRIAFLSSAILEFFTSLSIALTAVYFGFTYIGEFSFGTYGLEVTLYTGLFILILAPEFYQPLRELGTFYHAKAQALGAAESIVEFLETDIVTLNEQNQAQEAKAKLTLDNPDTIDICAQDLCVYATDNTRLIGPLNFTISAGQTTAIVGPSGAGKTTLMNAILGFLPYQGSLKINGIELAELDLADWRRQISWIGQNPVLLNGTILENLTLGNLANKQNEIAQAIKDAYADEFINDIGLDYAIKDRSGGLSVGQAQRIALARAMLQQGKFWLLDEPTASLDANSEQLILKAISTHTEHTTTLMITHQLDHLQQVAQILVLEAGHIVQQGHYNELEHCGLFANMLDSSKQYQQNQQLGSLDV